MQLCCNCNSGAVIVQSADHWHTSRRPPVRHGSMLPPTTIPTMPAPVTPLMQLSQWLYKYVAWRGGAWDGWVSDESPGDADGTQKERSHRLENHMLNLGQATAQMSSMPPARPPYLSPSPRPAHDRPSAGPAQLKLETDPGELAPSRSLNRDLTSAFQVILVIIFWFWRILKGDPKGPRFLWIRRANRALSASSSDHSPTDRCSHSVKSASRRGNSSLAR